MGKTAENIAYFLDPKNDKDYLKDLLFHIKEAHKNKSELTFKIVDARGKGFIVKAGGLFAYVSFKYFGWSYPSLEFWQNVSKHLIGHFFRGKIHTVTENPISIKINASEQIFKKPKLKESKTYKCVIVQKTKYGVFVDLGFHFNWKFGSLLGLIHKSTLTQKSALENWQLGDQITTIYFGEDKDGKPMLGDHLKNRKWFNGSLDPLVGTVQKTLIKINGDGNPEFFVLGEHHAQAPILKDFYPNYRTTAKKYTYALKDGETIDCEIVRINKKRNSFVIKLLVTPPTN